MIGGGTWSGSGVSGDKFNPAIAGPGNHTIRYDITNADGCSDSDTEVITVVPIPDATITPVSTLCASDAAISLSAHDMGGIWSGPGIAGNTFDPAISGHGNHTISYKIVDSNGCMDTIR